jgi:hypothetical protein
VRGLTDEQRGILTLCLNPDGRPFRADEEQMTELVARGLVRLEMAPDDPPRELVYIDRPMCLIALEADTEARRA